VILFSFESTFTNEHWEIAVAHFKGLELDIKEILDLLPNEVSSWSEDIASGDIVIFDHL
jgi:hypothetical protein